MKKSTVCLTEDVPQFHALIVFDAITFGNDRGIVLERLLSTPGTGEETMSGSKQWVLAATLACTVGVLACCQPAAAESNYDSVAVKSAEKAFDKASSFSGSSGNHYNAYLYAYYGWLYAYYADRYDYQPYWYNAYYYNYYAYYYAAKAYESDSSSGFWLTTPTSYYVRESAREAYIYSYYAYYFYR